LLENYYICLILEGQYHHPIIKHEFAVSVKLSNSKVMLL